MTDEITTALDCPADNCPTEGAEGYSIVAAVGTDRAAQLERAEWHARAAGILEADASTWETMAEKRIQQIRDVVKFNAGAIRFRANWHVIAIEEWLRANPPPGRKSVKLPSGEAALKTVAANLTVNDEALLAYAATRDDLYGECVELVPKVSKRAVLRRFTVNEQGDVVDLTTGEIIEPVKVTRIEEGVEVEVVTPLLSVSHPEEERFYFKPAKEGSDGRRDADD